MTDPIRKPASKFLQSIGKEYARPGDISAGDVGRALPETVVPQAPETRGSAFLAAQGKRYQPTAPAPVDPVNPPGTMVGRALTFGGNQLKSMAASGVEGFAQSTGLDTLEEKMRIAESNANLRMAELQPYRITLDQAKGSLGNSMLWAGQTILEQVPTVATAVPAVIGGMFGAVPAAIGTGLAVAGTYITSYGELRQSQEEADRKAGRAIEVDEGTAMLYAVPHTALDYIADKFLLGGLTPKPGSSLLTRFTKNATTGAVTESLTEVGQTVLERLQSGEDLTSDEAIELYKEVAITAGVAGGGIKGVVGSILPGAANPNQINPGTPLGEDTGTSDEDLGLASDAELVQASLEEQEFYQAEKSVSESPIAGPPAPDGQISPVSADYSPVTPPVSGSPGAVAGGAFDGAINSEPDLDAMIAAITAGEAQTLVDANAVDAEFESLDGFDIDNWEPEAETVNPQGFVPQSVIDKVQAEAPPDQSFFNTIDEVANVLNPVGYYPDSSIKLTGSNPNGVFETAWGNKAFVKINQSIEQTDQEIAASTILNGWTPGSYDYYAATGLGMKSNGLMTPYIDPSFQIAFDPYNAEHRAAVGKSFVAQAWLANWDAVGPDNANVVLVQNDNGLTPVYLDTGGSLEYRAKGDKKGDKFGPDVTELQTMKDGSKNWAASKAFADVTPEMMVEQALELAEQFRGHLNFSQPGTEVFQDPYLRYTMIERMLSIISQVEQHASPELKSQLDFTYKELDALREDLKGKLPKGPPGPTKKVYTPKKVYGVEPKKPVVYKNTSGQSIDAHIAKIVKNAENYDEFNANILAKHTGNDHITQTLLQEPLLYATLANPNFYEWVKGNKLWWDLTTQKLVVKSLSTDPGKLKKQLESEALLPPLLFHGTKYYGGVKYDSDTGLPYLFEEWKKGQISGVGGGDTHLGMFLTDKAYHAMSWAGTSNSNFTPAQMEDMLLKQVIPLYAKFEKPWLYDAKGTSWSASTNTALAAEGKKVGVDGLININQLDSVNGNQIIAFDPQFKVKSPFNKEFSPKTSVMHKSIAGKQSKFITLSQHERGLLQDQLKLVGLDGMVDLYYFPFNSAQPTQGVFRRTVDGIYIGLSLDMPSESGHLGIMRHEIIHALRSLGFFNTAKGKALWQILKEEVRRRGGITEFTKQNYNIRHWLEEEIARLAELHASGKLSPDSATRVGQALQMIRNFFRALSNWARGLGFQTAESALDYIFSGKLAQGGWLDDVSNRPDQEIIHGFEEEVKKSIFAVKKITKNPPQAGNPDYYGNLVKYGWNIMQLAKKNSHIPWLQNYVERARQWYQAKNVWLERANVTGNAWVNLAISDQQSLANFIFAMERMEYRTPAEITAGVVRKPTKPEFIALAKQYGMTKEGLDVYIQVRKDFDAILDKIEDVVSKSIAKQFAGNQYLIMLEVAKVQKEFAQLRKRPYFPHARFGNYTVVVKDSAGKTQFVEAFESLGDREAAMAAVNAKFPASQGFTVAKSMLSEEQKLYQGLPQALLLALKQNLNLTPTQQSELDQMIIHSAPAISFKHHLSKKKNIEGFSEDALRAYSQYFFHGANHLARIEFGPLLQEAIAEGDADVKQMLATGGSDSTKRVQMTDHLKHHYENIMNPKEDWAAFRSVAFMWYLGFNIKSAVVNFSQIPMVTYAHLGAQFGDVSTMKALTKNMNQMKNLFRSNAKTIQGMTPQQAKMMEEALADGLIDESFAAELAGLAEGSNLHKSMTKNRWRKLGLQFNHYGAYLFQAVEKLNRRVAFTASLDLAAGVDLATHPYAKEVAARSQLKIQELVNKGWTADEALRYAMARDAVDQTQFNYSKFAQPRMMEGRKNAFLTFFMFVQNMLWFLQNNPGMTRYLLVLLVFAGIKGLPFQDDMEQLVEGVAARLGYNLDLEREVREFTQATFGDAVNPDLLLRGISRQGFGLKTIGDMTGLPLPGMDLSGSLSMGSPVHVISPMVQAAGKLLKGQDYEDVMAGFTADSVGPAFGIPLEMIKAIAANDLPWNDPKRWEAASPSALRNLMRAGRYATEGEERTRTGATLVEFDKNDMEAWMEIVAQAAGFTNTRVSRAWDKAGMLREAEMFWAGRRGGLYAQYYRAKSYNDKDGLEAVMKAVERYNKSVPFSQMRIGKKDLEKSFKQRTTAAGKREAGLPATKALIPVFEEIKGLHRD